MHPALIPHSHSYLILLLALFALAFASACRGDDEPDTTATVTTAHATPTATASSTPAPTETGTPAPTAPPATPPVPTPAGLAPIAPRTPAVFGQTITLSAVGDVSLAREVVPRMQANGAGYPYALITHLLDGDIVVGNLEGALTDRGEPWPKGYNFRTPPQYASGLAGAGFDLVSVANNHAMDYGTIGLEDTLGALTANGVRWAGAGIQGIGQGQRPATDFAYDPVVLESNGLRVAIIACALSPTEGGGFAITDWGVQPNATGIVICSPDRVTAQVQQARTMADFVIVYPHAGDEYINTPNAAQRSIADAALAAGADAFIGHHAHVVQPIEQRGNQLIAWGLGNFIFDLDEVDLANIPQPRVTLVLRLTLTKGAGVTAYDVLPAVLDANEDRPRPATVDEAVVLQSLVGG